MLGQGRAEGRAGAHLTLYVRGPLHPEEASAQFQRKPAGGLSGLPTKQLLPGPPGPSRNCIGKRRPHLWPFRSRSFEASLVPLGAVPPAPLLQLMRRLG